jgi:hypothetical protein
MASIRRHLRVAMRSDAVAERARAAARNDIYELRFRVSLVRDELSDASPVKAFLEAHRAALGNGMDETRQREGERTNRLHELALLLDVEVG